MTVVEVCAEPATGFESHASAVPVQLERMLTRGVKPVANTCAWSVPLDGTVTEYTASGPAPLHWVESFA